MELDQDDGARLYAAIFLKLARIKEECGGAKGGEGFFLAADRYADFLRSIGISVVRWKKSRKTPPHWATLTKPEEPAETEANIIIPDPFFANHNSPNPINNDQKERALLVPKETAEKMLLLGIP